MVAVLINLAITLAKAVPAVLTGSPVLWAETAHSLADTGNEVLLFVGLRRSAHPPDRRHPFGYGQERWFWTFLAALGLCVVGGVLSVSRGIQTLREGAPVEDVPIGIIGTQRNQRARQLARSGGEIQHPGAWRAVQRPAHRGRCIVRTMLGVSDRRCTE